MFELYKEINKTLKGNNIRDLAVMKEDVDFEFIYIELMVNGYKIVINESEDIENNFDISLGTLNGETKIYGDYTKCMKKEYVLNRILEVINE